jgi:hypothetical protein
MANPRIVRREGVYRIETAVATGERSLLAEIYRGKMAALERLHALRPAANAPRRRATRATGQFRGQNTGQDVTEL